MRHVLFDWGGKKVGRNCVCAYSRNNEFALVFQRERKDSQDAFYILREIKEEYRSVFKI